LTSLDYTLHTSISDRLLNNIRKREYVRNMNKIRHSTPPRPRPFVQVQAFAYRPK